MQASALARSSSTRSSIALILGLIIEKTIGFRITEEDEIDGIDLTEHAETAYDFGGSGGGSGGGSLISTQRERQQDEKVDA